MTRGRGFSNQVAIVTGGGGDIGREISLQYARAGAVVAVVDLNLTAAEDTKQQIESEGGRALAMIPLDGGMGRFLDLGEDYRAYDPFKNWGR